MASCARSIARSRSPLSSPAGDPAPGKIQVAGAKHGEQDPYEYRQAQKALLEPAEFEPQGLFDRLGRVEG